MLLILCDFVCLFSLLLQASLHLYCVSFAIVALLSGSLQPTAQLGIVKVEGHCQEQCKVQRNLVSGQTLGVD